MNETQETSDKSIMIYSTCAECGDEWHDNVNSIPQKEVGDKVGSQCMADGHTCLGDRIINKITIINDSSIKSKRGICN